MSSSSAESFKTRTYRVVIDSRDRDRVAFPKPCKYEISLDDDLRDVVSVRLVGADVPFASHTLPFTEPASGRTFTVRSQAFNGGAPVNVVMSPGNYTTIGDLVSEIGQALSRTILNSFVDVDYDQRQDMLYFFADQAFDITCDLYKAPKVAKLLGLQSAQPPQSAQQQPVPQPQLPKLGSASSVPTSTVPNINIASARAQGLRMPYRVDTSGERYIVMDLTPNAELLTSVNDAINRTFAIIPSSADTNVSWREGAAVEKSWSTPIARLSKVGISFLDYYGNDYDFQNQDHRVELIFRCLAQSQAARMYATAPTPWPNAAARGEFVPHGVEFSKSINPPPSTSLHVPRDYV